MNFFLKLGFMLCFYYLSTELHMTHKGQRPLHLLIVHINLLENREDQRVSVFPSACIHCIFVSPGNSGAASPEHFNAWNYREDGWGFLVWFVYVLLGFFWKQAGGMSCYLELDLCQAAISEPQAAWRLTLGESKSCAFTPINERECCFLVFWLPGEKKE